MDARDLDALELVLPVGAENGTTVKKLALALGWPKDGRKVRQGFQELRRDRHVAVVALSVVNGVYVLPEGADLSDLKRTRNGLSSRAMSELVTVREIDLLIADREWQPMLFSQAI